MVGTYKFGQFRSNQKQDYIKAIQYTLDNKPVKSNLSGATFLDKAIELSGANQIQRDEQGNIRSFYLRIKIYKNSSSIQNFNIVLRNTTSPKDNSQILGSAEIPKGDEADFSVFDFVFCPNEHRTFNQIHFELQRTIDDDNIQNPDGTFGRKVNLEVQNLSEINNVIETLNPSIEGKGELKQIGIQTAPGLIMCINGEQIKVGRSGQYEVKNSNIKIYFLGFIIENSDKLFILDYQY